MRDVVVSRGYWRASGRRFLRQPIAVSALVLLVALVVAGVLASVLRGGGSKPAAAPTHPAIISVAEQPPPTAIDIPSESPAVELDGQLTTVFAGRLWWTSLDGVSSGASSIDASDGYLLVPDLAQHRVWVLLPGMTQAEIVAVSTRDSRRQFAFDFSPGLSGGAILDGRLYASSTHGVSAVQSSGFGYSTQITPLRGNWSMAADPSRHRLLLTDLSGATASVRAQRPTDPHPEAQATLPFGKGWVVVTGGGQIWAAGYGNHGAVLARLDPTTLRVVAQSPAAAQLGPGAIVVGTGRESLLVRSGAGGDGLWCVDARTGAVDEAWTAAPGAIAIGPDGGYEFASTGEPPRLLTGGRCPG